MDPQEIIATTRIIRSEPLDIDSLDQLPMICKQVAKTRKIEGAALVQCRRFLPTNISFPGSTTKFHKPRTMGFLRRSRAAHYAEDILQINPFAKNPNPIYKKVDASSAREAVMTPLELYNTLEEAVKSTDRLQSRLVIDEKTFTEPMLKVGSPLSEYDERITGVTTAQRVISLGKSIFEAILGDWGLGWYSLLLAGASSIFVVIAPESTTAFETLISNAFRIRRRLCSQFIRHYGILPSISLLHRHKIQFSVMQQRPGDVAIILPGTYCYGVETGSNYSTNISWAFDDWDPAQVDYMSCTAKCGAEDIIKRPESHRHDQVGSTTPSVVIDSQQAAATSTSSVASKSETNSAHLSRRRGAQDSFLGDRPLPSGSSLLDRRPQKTRRLNRSAEAVVRTLDFSGTSGKMAATDKLTPSRSVINKMVIVFPNTEDGLFASPSDGGAPSPDFNSTGNREIGVSETPCSTLLNNGSHQVGPDNDISHLDEVDQGVMGVLTLAKANGDATEQALAQMVEIGWIEIRRKQNLRLSNTNSQNQDY